VFKNQETQTEFKSLKIFYSAFLKIWSLFFTFNVPAARGSEQNIVLAANWSEIVLRLPWLVGTAVSADCPYIHIAVSARRHQQRDVFSILNRSLLRKKGLSCNVHTYIIVSFARNSWFKFCSSHNSSQSLVLVIYVPIPQRFLEIHNWYIYRRLLLQHHTYLVHINNQFFQVIGLAPITYPPGRVKSGINW
jgi:hypothetical protein